MEDIAAEAKNFGMIGLQGTCSKAYMNESYRMTRVLDRVAVVAGWKHSKYSNKSAGCTFLLPPRWPQKCIRRIDTPPMQLQGRGVG
eukprot:5468459-Pyramimonas_sp.AAC.1